MVKERNRAVYLCITIIVIILGLSTRYFTRTLPKWMILYAGDTLWALMIFLILGFVFKKLASIKIALLATVFAFLIELTQLYSSPWIDGIRRTKIGGLILGYGFLWSDILCYCLGISIGFCLDIMFLRQFDDK